MEVPQPSDEATGPTLPETSAEAPATTTEAAEPSPTEPSPTGPEQNERGNIVKELGEEGGLIGADGEPVFTFAVDAVAPAQCTSDWKEYGSPPEQGHLMAVKLRFATAPELADDEMLSYYTVTAYDFDFIGADGVTVTELDSMATYGCLPDKEMFTQDALSPGQKYVGSLVIDVPDTKGVLIYRPSVAEGGWEWQF